MTAALPKVSNGKIERLENFASQYIAPRHIDIWLPDTYSPEKKFPVLYMHDGQMLFDPAITWNGQSWGVSETMTDLIKKGEIRPAIVVGIWNSGDTRYADYFPQKPYETLPESVRDVYRSKLKSEHGIDLFTTDVQSDSYLKFLVTELKPFIDQNYATLPDQQNTFIAGSSMGGLISIYALCEYPEIFHGAACLSTHWPGSHSNKENPVPDALLAYLEKNLPSPANHRIYFDYGTEALDALYKTHQLRVDKIVQRKGYHQKNWKTLEDEGAEHSEAAWQKRLHIPLKFLIAP